MSLLFYKFLSNNIVMLCVRREGRIPCAIELLQLTPAPFWKELFATMSSGYG